MQFDSRGTVRNIIPRWRPVIRSINLGEAWRADKREETPEVVESHQLGLTRALDEFRRHRTAPYAAEVVAAAVVVGVPKKGERAARFLDRYEGNVFVNRRLIDSCLGRASVDETPMSGTKGDIRAFRVAGPYVRRGGFAWLDLALAHASCGQYSKAKQALTVARGLVGASNRLVLRAEARLCQHMGEPDRSLAALRRDPNLLLADPWLMAPEIGLSQLVGKHSRLLRRARSTLEHGDQPPFEISELAAAVATAEQAAGKHRFARKLFRLAVVKPAALGLAQTVWAAREVDQLIRVPDAQAIRESAEACARDALAQLRWQEAQTACKAWHQEEPFATTPVIILSSLLSTHLDDHEGAIKAADSGLLANPRHPSLLNNRAFALATIGRLNEAEANIREIKSEGTNQNVTNQICTTATLGLIALRRGQSGEGEQLYRKAMRMAHDAQNTDLAARAGIYLLREAYLAGLSHLVKDDTVLNTVYAKGIHPSTQCLRKKIAERDLHGLLRNVVNKSIRRNGLQQHNSKTPIATVNILPRMADDFKD